MKKYIVISPFAVFAIVEGNSEKEYSLKKGDIVELPETHIAVRALVLRKQLKEVAETTQQTDERQTKTSKK
ncbi:hypothetical protein LJB95_00945 [Paludibacteraceae bacterium OttesenSCG-928-F17]|nr:hypothetical protein [Paludibacteraceae bacterium OttesenSCG-928-F17]